MASLRHATHGELLVRAAEGDQAAWDVLVERFSPMVWAVVRGFRLDEATAKDVSQTVWLRLVENLSRIEEPERLPGWLATTTRREALRVKTLRERMVPSDFDYDLADPSPSLEAMLVEDEEAREVLHAFEALSGDCRQLLRLLSTEPPLSYEVIAEIIGRPVGSLGPTRSRCLDRLKALMAARISGPGEASIDLGADS